MQHYELLCVLPGTFSEEEVKPVVEQITSAITTAGGTEVQVEPTSKSRLAYPMKHIRYGYFQLVYFQAEPKAVPAIEAKLRLVDGLLRVLVHKHDPANKPKEHMTLVGIANPVAARKEEAAAPQDPAMATQKVRRAPEKKAEEKPAEPTETKAEAVNLDDINKKLDQLLEDDIPNV